ncbi:isoprenyl transferase [Oryzicola mucosus]|uniref:Isoprenyl transferase n=1 Tax=Oryzicola mucosus TaxID=2767425 RepID=A0A8J6PMX0_9HYPH|nr:isoprenyl transferase [Oryzicola mucosus]MBD0416301.1 isoprenyl transferase [Oryzicola mucosus]
MTTPTHIAIIMDGNGRWAKARGLPRAAGHKAGVDALRRTVRSAGDLGVKWVTVYAFSSENWSRPQTEVTDLMSLLKIFIRRDLAELHNSGVRVKIIGDRHNLKADIRGLLEEAETLTARNSAMTLVIAFNYGGRDEIARAAAKAAQAIADGRFTAAELTPERFEGFLDTIDIPDPDLLIRTSGEVRLSNFLLWQLAYTELVFMPCYWPDFGREQLLEAISEYTSRDRRFGGLVDRDVAS